MNDIIRELVNRERRFIKDADNADQTGPTSVEALHTDGTGARVLLHFKLTSAWRADAEGDRMRAFDFWNAGTNTDTERGSSDTDDTDEAVRMTNEDFAPLITVNWEAVEADCDHVIEPNLRRVIEHIGGTSSTTLDKWGYEKAPTVLSVAVHEHSRLIHPKHGSLDARYAPFDKISFATHTLRELRGDDMGYKTSSDGDFNEFIDGLADLCNAARALDERRDDWPDNHHPAISSADCSDYPILIPDDGSHDNLGRYYIHVEHDDRVLDSIDVEDLPVEREEKVAYPYRTHHSVEGNATAAFYHERFFSEDTETTPNRR